jgi:hypothetical protein
MTSGSDRASSPAPLAPELRIERRAGSRRQTCRCGRRLGPEVQRFEIIHEPVSLRSIVHEQAFCSVVCVRALLLEALSELEALSSPYADRTVIDLRQAYLDLRRAYAEMRSDPDFGG